MLHTLTYRDYCIASPFAHITCHTHMIKIFSICCSSFSSHSLSLWMSKRTYWLILSVVSKKWEVKARQCSAGLLATQDYETIFILKIVHVRNCNGVMHIKETTMPHHCEWVCVRDFYRTLLNSEMTVNPFWWTEISLGEHEHRFNTNISLCFVNSIWSPVRWVKTNC